MGTTPVVYTEDTRPQFHWGSGAPAPVLGVDGDGYLDITNARLYGPKTAGVWGSGQSLVGPTGATGAAGPMGPSGSSAAVETGTIIPFAGITVPSNYLLCNGQAVSRTTYAALFGVLATTIATFTVTIATPGVVTCVGHGLVDGDSVYFTTTGALPTGLAVDTSYYVVNATTNTFQIAATRGGAAINTTGSQSGTHTLKRAPWGGVTASNFAVPDLRGRVLVGVDNMGGTDAGILTVSNAFGLTGGEETHVLTESEMPSHTHIQNSHTHTQNLGGSISNVANTAGTYVIGNANTSTTAGTVATNQNTGGGQAHNNMPPYATLNYIIKT